MFEQRVKELAEKGYILERLVDYHDNCMVFRILKDGRILHRKVFLRELYSGKETIGETVFKLNRIIDEMVKQIDKENENA